MTDAPEPPNHVIAFSGITRLDLSVERVLEKARHLQGVVILGYDQDGDEYFASTYADGGIVMWLLRKCEHNLLAAASSLETV